MEINGTYGIQQTFYFSMVKAGSNDFAVSADYTPVAADSRLSKDGGAWAQTTNPVVDETEGWSITLTATEMQATRIHVQIRDAATKAVEDNALIVHTGLGAQIEANKGTYVCEVETAQAAAATNNWEAHFLAPTTTIETTADHFNGRLILFTTGALTGQMTDITDYVLSNANAKFTVTAVTEVPADGDRFVVL